MFRIGLTGGIASGKSTIASMFAKQHISVFNADDAVHGLLGDNEHVYEAILTAFPSAIIDGKIDRQALGALVFDDNAALSGLELILHPQVQKLENTFVAEQVKAGQNMVVCDIPLLFETHRQADFNLTVLAACSVTTQRHRAMARQGMTEEKLAAILAHQLPLEKKRDLADVIIDTDCDLEQTRHQIQALIEKTQAQLRSK